MRAFCIDLLEVTSKKPWKPTQRQPDTNAAPAAESAELAPEEEKAAKEAGSGEVAKVALESFEPAGNTKAT